MNPDNWDNNCQPPNLRYSCGWSIGPVCNNESAPSLLHFDTPNKASLRGSLNCHIETLEPTTWKKKITPVANIKLLKETKYTLTQYSQVSASPSVKLGSVPRSLRMTSSSQCQESASTTSGELYKWEVIWQVSQHGAASQVNAKCSNALKSPEASPGWVIMA